MVNIREQLFDVDVNVTKIDRTNDLAKILKDLGKMRVLVGVPEEKAAREGEKINNAQLVFIHTHGVHKKSVRKEMKPNVDKYGYPKALQMYIQEHGSPMMSVPPRPIIEPALNDKESQPIISGKMKAVAQKELSGNKEEAKEELENAALTAQIIVQKWWDNPNNNWPPNAQSTIARKGSDRPLIDIGELRKSITGITETGDNK